MSNIVYVDYTRFTNLKEDHEEGLTMYGYTIADNYASDYFDNYESYDELVESVHSNNLLEVINRHEQFRDIDLETEMPLITGVSFNGTFYSLEQIQFTGGKDE